MNESLFSFFFGGIQIQLDESNSNLLVTRRGAVQKAWLFFYKPS